MVSAVADLGEKGGHPPPTINKESMKNPEIEFSLKFWI